MSSNERSLISSDQLDAEDAETHLLHSLEKRNENLHPGSSNEQEADLQRAFSGPNQPPGRPPRLKSIVKRVQMLKQASIKRNISGSSRGSGHRHKRNQSSAQELLNAIQDMGKSSVDSENSDDREKNDQFLVETVLDADESSDEESRDGVWADEDDQSHPLLPTQQSQYGSVNMLPDQKPKIYDSRGWKALTKCFDRLRNGTLNWKSFGKRFFDKIVCSYLVFIGFPLFGLAWILFYQLGNPELDFLPGRARLSWWCNFLGRQVVTFELARLAQWLLLDLIIIRTRLAARLLGPLTIMSAIQAKGWPFLIVAWSCWDLLLLHGDNDFQTHWFYWTELAIYSSANSGSYILISDTYLRALISMIIAGLAATAKRTVMTVRFGKKQFSKWSTIGYIPVASFFLQLVRSCFRS